MPPPGRKMNAKQAAAMKAKRAEKAAKTGAQVKVRHAEEMAVHLKTFQEQLEAFAAAHKKQIATDPQFRAQFNRMCREVGVDPLQCAPSSIACYSALRLLVLPRPHAPATPSNLAPPPAAQPRKASGQPLSGTATSTTSLGSSASRSASAPARRTGCVARPSHLHRAARRQPLTLTHDTRRRLGRG
jgi:hypothetical protein